MKKVLLLSAILSLLLAASCMSDDEKELQTKGKIRFTCNSDYDYMAYIDDNYKAVVFAHTFQEFYVAPGFHYFKAVQKNGYVVYPTVKNTSFTFAAGSELEFTFP